VHSERWAKYAAGGPSSGPVVLAIGRAETLTAHRLDDGGLSAKLLVLVDALPGTAVDLSVRAMSGSSSDARLTHFAASGPSVGGRARDPGQWAPPPVDIPGTLEVDAPGQFELTVAVAGHRPVRFCMTV
jgi:hypothetical protein